MPDTPPQAPPALTRAAQRALDTASTLFYDHGIHAVGVDRIAAEAGVTKRTLYERFGSKENLVLAYLRRREGQWRDVVAEHLARHPDPGPDRVLAVFDAAEAWYPRRSTKGCSAVNARAEVDADPADQPVLAEVVSQKRWMLGQLVALVEEAGYAEPDRLGAHLLLLLEGALVTLGTRALASPVQDARDAAVSLLEHATEDIWPTATQHSS